MIYVLKRFLWRFAAQVVFFIATLRKRAKSFVAYRITKSFERYVVVKEFETVSSNGLAIVALYPRQGILKSAIRLIDSLITSNYSVLVVVNESQLSSEWLSVLSTKPIEVITRPNIGRDFGAYKIGFQYAEEKGFLTRVDNLLFANDSVLYGPNSNEFVLAMLKIDAPWLSMFVNYEFHIHAQSFFQVFQKEIFLRKDFSKFWHNYTPSELRIHTIVRGELALSAQCLSRGESPIAFVTATAILANSAFKKFAPDEEFGILNYPRIPVKNENPTTKEDLKTLMREQFLETNVTHSMGLLAARVLSAPLKLDINATGLITKDGVTNTLESMGFQEQEATELVQIIMSKSPDETFRGYKRLRFLVAKWCFQGLAK